MHPKTLSGKTTPEHVHSFSDNLHAHLFHDTALPETVLGMIVADPFLNSLIALIQAVVIKPSVEIRRSITENLQSLTLFDSNSWDIFFTARPEVVSNHKISSSKKTYNHPLLTFENWWLTHRNWQLLQYKHTLSFLLLLPRYGSTSPLAFQTQQSSYLSLKLHTSLIHYDSLSSHWVHSCTWVSLK